MARSSASRPTNADVSVGRLFGRRSRVDSGSELGRQPRKGKLEETLRPPEVLQSMFPEVAQRGAGREPALDEAGGRLGQQDLAAVTGRHDPRRPVHRGPKEVPAARLHLAGVDPHPHPDGAPVRPRLREQPVLSGDRGRHGADRNGEDGHESVAGRLDDLAARIRRSRT